MNKTQFDTLKHDLPDNIFGQKIGMVLVSDSGLNASAKKSGIRKVTRYNVAISKRSHVDIINTTTGAEKIGATFSQLAESNYDSEKLNGFLCHLKTDDTKKYVTLRWDDDKTNIHNTVYVDINLNVIAETFEQAKTLDIFTPSYIKSIEEGYGRTAVLKTADINVQTITVKIENIAVLKVCGHEVIDNNLTNYAKLAI